MIGAAALVEFQDANVVQFLARLFEPAMQVDAKVIEDFAQVANRIVHLSQFLWVECER